MKKVILNMNELKKYKVIKLVSEGRKSKKRAAVELNLTIRHINRLLNAYRKEGKEAFSHGNRNKSVKHAVPQEIKKKIINIYQALPVPMNFVHFTEHLEEQYQIVYSDTTIRKILYSAGILSPKSHRKTRREMKKRLKRMLTDESNEVALQEELLPSADQYLEAAEKVHPSRPRKKYCGELIQMDASVYRWFGDEDSHLHLAIDDASGNILAAYFDTQETLNGYYNLLYQIVLNYGIPVTILTDKRTVFTYQSKAMKQVEEDTYTQFGFACHQLGIELQSTSIPQAKGRIERLNGTVQSRLAADLALAGIETIEDANEFLKKWIKKYNRKFAQLADESVFEEKLTPSKANIILARVANRKINNGHHIRYHNEFYLPMKNSEELYFTRGSEVLVIEAFNGEIYVNIADEIYHTRRLESHELHSNTFDEVVEKKKERRPYIPPQSHPWKLASFRRYLNKQNKKLEDYDRASA